MPQSQRSRGLVGYCGCGDIDMDLGSGGIPRPRGCTDLVWLICYVVFCCILILIAGFALVYGNPKRLINGMDSFGNVCGTVNEDFGNWTFSGQDMTEKPYVFYFDSQNMKTSTKICVKECPSERIDDISHLQEYYVKTLINFCRYDFTPENNSSSTSGLEFELDKILCPKFPIYASHPVLKRCVPVWDESDSSKTKMPVLSEPDLFAAVYKYLNSLNIFQQVLGDLAVTWTSVLGLTIVAFVISLLLIIVMHWMTALVAHVILLLSALFSIIFTGLLWWTYLDIKSKVDSTKEEMQLDEICRNEKSFLIYSIVATIFTVVLLLVILVVRKRVAIVVRLFREAGTAMLSMPCLWIQPFITYAALTAFFSAWLYIVLCIATSDYPARNLVTQGHPNLTVSNNGSIEPISLSDVTVNRGNKTFSLDDLNGWTLIEYSDEAWVKYMWFFYIFGLLWCSEFILACQQMVIASSVSAWYFSRSRSTMGCIVLKSIIRMIQYHIGSVALGSLIITFIKLPRLILQFCQRIFRKWEDYRVIQWLSRCCVCFLRCFENCMKYVHHNAYTVISIQGVNFCPASRLAFSALVQNALQISVINSIGDFVLFLAKCMVAALTGLIAVVMFKTDETLYYYAIPVLLTVVFSYFVAHCVISVFEMAVDTLFLCFCEDHNMNDGTDGKEYYAPRSLLQYMTIDAVDAIAPGRRSHLESPSHLKKSQIPGIKETASPEETIPMNPYSETTTPNE